MGEVVDVIIMALGDTHGDRGFTKGAISWAAENGVDRLVQVGDFGYWPRINPGQTFLHDVGKHAHLLNVPFYWLDGNHDDHLMIEGTLRSRGGDMISHGKYPITYLNRGARWEWDGVWFGAFGGAFSIDRWGRTENSGQWGWFADEMPDESKIEDLGHVDVLFTHDSPIIPPIVYAVNKNLKSDETSRLSQSIVYAALVNSKASLLIHGHWHVNDRYKVAGAVIQGLDMNQHGLHGAVVLFDTADRRLYTIREWEYRDAQQE